ncbi:MAG: hypothetical protein JWO11_3525 [Nocardioides sp.]|nr:hypothetical protein [Nocardioides sp.]
MAITPVGSLRDSYATSQATLSVTPVNVGDAWLLSVFIVNTSISTTAVSGGGATGWTKVAPTTAASNGVGNFELWLGTIGTAGASTITLTYSASITGTDVELDAQEFSSGLGAGTVWAKDGSQAGFNNNASSTTIAYPTLVPAGSGELYFGFMISYAGGTSAGPTSGYSYFTTSNGDQVAYNGNISASTSPTSSTPSAGISFGDGVLITASVAATASPPYPGLLVSRLRPYFG